MLLWADDRTALAAAAGVLMLGCGAADVDDAMWQKNPIGGDDAFLQGGPPTPGATSPTSPTGTVPSITPTTPGDPTTNPTANPTGPSVTPGTPTGAPTTTPTGTPTTTPTAPPPPPGTNSGPCAVTLDFTTVSIGGKYAPRHVQAAWVETGDSRFIQSLAVNGFIRASNLVIWNAQSGGNTVDAITGATLTGHGAHTVSWDCVDLSGAPVMDGAYKIIVEFTEDNSGGFFGPPSAPMVADFMKGAGPVDAAIPDFTGYRNIRLTLR